MPEANGSPKYHSLLPFKLSSNSLPDKGTKPPPDLIPVNASRGLKGSTTTLRVNSRTRSKFNSREDVLKEKKQLYLQKRAKQRQQLEEQSGENLEFLQALDVKECMLEIQSVMLGKLAAEENHVKGLVEIPEQMIVNFNERAREVAEALTMLKY